MAWWMAIPAILSAANSAKNLFSDGGGGGGGGEPDIMDWMGQSQDAGPVGGSSGIGDILKRLGSGVLDNPMELLAVLSGMSSGRQDRKMSDTQRHLLEFELSRRKKADPMRGQAMEALQRMFAQGPFAQQYPDMSGLFMK